jgi:hypothetical protein
VKAFVLLADAAEEVNGKVYILGAGWTDRPAPGAMKMGIAIFIDFDLEVSEVNSNIELVLLNGRGRPAKSPDGQPIVITGTLTGRRTPSASTDLPITRGLALNVVINLVPDTYTWRLALDGKRVARRRFVVHAGS